VIPNGTVTKREGREWEREQCTNIEATGHGKRPDLDQIRAPQSSDLHHNPHPNNLQNSSAYNTWFFNKNGQLKIIGTQGADLCTPNQINKTRTVSCPIYNAHHPDCNRSFRWCVRGQIPQCSAQSDEPLNHIPYPLLSFSASQDPSPRNPAATFRDFGRGPIANQTHNESSHIDNPITPTQQICRHRPLLPLILHKSNALLTTTWMQTNPHRSTFSYQISPTSHTSKARTPYSFH
jgi:hypothetical protein